MIFPLLGELREPVEAMSEAVDSVCIYPAGVAIEFVLERLTRERMISDVELWCRVLSILRR